MLSPARLTTRSGLMAGKKRPVTSPSGREDNNNQTPPKLAKKQQARTPTKQQAHSTSRDEARTFAKWLQNMLDNDRHNLTLYLADDVILEWFGRTVKSRKKVSGFLQYDMQCSRHNFMTVFECAPFLARTEKVKRDALESPKISVLAKPLDIAETPTAKLKASLNLLTVQSTVKKRPGLRSDSSPAKLTPEKRLLSPEWDSTARHNAERDASSEKKQAKLNSIEPMEICNDSDSGRGKSETKSRSFCRQLRFDNGSPEPDSKLRDSILKRKIATPTKREIGQGDCLPSTSHFDIAKEAHDLLIKNLPRKYVECNGFIEFTRSKNKRCIDTMKWERKCKVQVSYTDDPVNVGEYTIWTIIYSDDIKCKRNLLAAFEEVAKEEEAKKKLA